MMLKKRIHSSINKDCRLHKSNIFQLFIPFLYWLLVWTGLFLFLQTNGKYHFYYIEQNQLFLFDTHYIITTLQHPAGFAQLLADFCMSFYIRPYGGAVWTSLMLTLIGIFTSAILKKRSPHYNRFILSLLPIVLFLFILFDYNYQYTGIVAYLIMLCLLYLYVHLKNDAIRLVYACFSTIVLFWGTGSVIIPFIISILLWEILKKTQRAYLFLLPVLVAALFLGIYTRLTSVEQCKTLLFSNYFTEVSLSDAWYNFFWICMPVSLLITALYQPGLLKRSIRTGLSGLQLLAIGLLYWLSFTKYTHQEFSFYNELDYYMRNGQWDEVIKRYGETTDTKNDLYDCCLNIALAEKQVLTDSLFYFNPHGIRSLYLQWNQSSISASLLNELYFSMGHIALAQRMAFEANVNAYGYSNPRMLKRLVQTNLIFGTYDVAEKYISILEKSIGYRSWATQQRHFLRNDKNVENDPLLGQKRKCIPAENFLSELTGLDVDLKKIIRQNPAHKQTFQYLSALYLLNKDMDNFKELLQTYYGTEVLPALPKSFQEAVVLLSEDEIGYWRNFQVPTGTVGRYNGYRKKVLDERYSMNTLKTTLEKEYGDTFWYYALFIELDPTGQDETDANPKSHPH